MNNFTKDLMDKNFDKFRDQVRTYMTKKLCTDERIMEYMEKKEKYQAMADTLKTSRDKFEEKE